MNRLVRLFGTSIGRKLVMAVTGIALIGFVLAHMVGNMAIFRSSDALNAYADWLQGHPLIWIARAGLLGVFLLHIVTAASLVIDNRRARPVAYRRKEFVEAKPSSRFIVVSGLLILAFVVFHLGHFTFGVVQPEYFGGVDTQGRHDVFRMVVGAFRNPLLSAAYIAAMLLIGLHLKHGIESLVQTLGFNHDSYSALISTGSKAIIGTIVLGNCAFPVLILLGVIGGGE